MRQLEGKWQWLLMISRVPGSSHTSAFPGHNKEDGTGSQTALTSSLLSFLVAISVPCLIFSSEAEKIWNTWLKVSLLYTVFSYFVALLSGDCRNERRQRSPLERTSLPQNWGNELHTKTGANSAIKNATQCHRWCHSLSEMVALMVYEKLWCIFPPIFSKKRE